MDKLGAQALARQIVSHQIAFQRQQGIKRSHARWEWWRDQCRALYDLLGVWGVTMVIFALVLGSYAVYKHIQHQIHVRRHLPRAEVILRELMEMDSPQFNLTLYGCPQGVPGMRSPWPEDLSHDLVPANHNLHARCFGGSVHNCDGYIGYAKYAWKKVERKKKFDARMMLGPIAHVHPYQAAYCRMTIEEFCFDYMGRQACHIRREVVQLAESIAAESKCDGEFLMGATGPPAPLNAYQCDVYLRMRGE